MKIYLKGRNGVYDATAEYEDGKITVLKGTKIQMDFAEHIRGGRLAKKFRESREYVDENGLVIKDCDFECFNGSTICNWEKYERLSCVEVRKESIIKDYLESK